jgi:hypothetical protein
MWADAVAMAVHTLVASAVVLADATATALLTVVASAVVWAMPLLARPQTEVVVDEVQGTRHALIFVERSSFYPLRARPQTDVVVVEVHHTRHALSSVQRSCLYNLSFDTAYHLVLELGLETPSPRPRKETSLFQKTPSRDRAIRILKKRASFYQASMLSWAGKNVVVTGSNRGIGLGE